MNFTKSIIFGASAICISITIFSLPSQAEVNSDSEEYYRLKLEIVKVPMDFTTSTLKANIASIKNNKKVVSPCSKAPTAKVLSNTNKMKILDIKYYAKYQVHLEQQDSARELLNYANTMITHECFKDADKVYRAVISNYTSPTFQAERQEAQIGIDDIRSKQK